MWPCYAIKSLQGTVWFRVVLISWSVVEHDNVQSFFFFLIFLDDNIDATWDNPVLLDQNLEQPQLSDSSGISLTWWLSFRIIPSLEALTAKQKSTSGK